MNTLPGPNVNSVLMHLPLQTLLSRVDGNPVNFQRSVLGAVLTSTVGLQVAQLSTFPNGPGTQRTAYTQQAASQASPDASAQASSQLQSTGTANSGSQVLFACRAD